MINMLHICTEYFEHKGIATLIYITQSTFYIIIFMLWVTTNYSTKHMKTQLTGEHKVPIFHFCTRRLLLYQPFW